MVEQLKHKLLERSNHMKANTTTKTVWVKQLGVYMGPATKTT